MRRRRALALFGGAAAAWPFAARTQQTATVPRIGVVQALAADDPEAPARVTAFERGLRDSGWIVGRTVHIDYRWSGGDVRRARQHVAELVALRPALLLASGASIVSMLQEATATIPIVFVTAVDPVGAGLVASLARPGGNTTGFVMFEYGTSAKFLELLKEISPRVTRVAVLRDPANPVAGGQLGAIQAVAASFRVEITPFGMRDAAAIERDIGSFARTPNGGLIVTGSALTLVHRKLIVALAARHRLPAVYYRRLYVFEGGLASYGPDLVDQYGRAAGYADRILKGEKPADMPVQAPTKYELVLNLKTAKALGLELPSSLVVRADEVFE